MTSAFPTMMPPALTVRSGQCAALRSRASVLCERSERLRGRSQAIAGRFAAAQRDLGQLWDQALGREVQPARSSVVPIGGGAATEVVLRDYIAATCLGPGDTALRDDEPLLANGILDSLGIVRLAAFIEETFGVAVPDDALLPEHFGTVRRVAALVERLEGATGRCRLGAGQGEANGRAPTSGTLDPDAAAVAVDHRLGKIEPQPAALGA
jgi:acyl carrier protein